MTTDPTSAYRQLCATTPEIPLFSQPLWLDAVMGPQGWAAVVDGPPERPTAGLPFGWDRRYGFRRLLMPPLTQQFYLSLHPPPDLKRPSRIGFALDAWAALASRLPPYDLLDLNLHFDAPPPLPLQARGIELLARWGYILPLAGDPDALWAGAHERARRAVRKAERQLATEEAHDAAELARLVGLSFGRQGLRVRWGAALLGRVVDALQAAGRGRVLLARTATGELAAALLLAWDARTAYVPASGFDPRLAELNGPSLLYWRAIEAACCELQLQAFDFVGSMHPRIEPARRVWGGELRPYVRLRHIRHPLLRLLR